MIFGENTSSKTAAFSDVFLNWHWADDVIPYRFSNQNQVICGSAGNKTTLKFHPLLKAVHIGPFGAKK